MALKSSRRSELRAEAHKLSPVVIIGDKGLTDAVLAEIDRSLKTHELIKVRAGTDDREARKTWLPSICERLGAEAVQSIGKVFVIYRENPKEKSDPRVRAEKPKLDSRRSLPSKGFIRGGNDKDKKPTVRRLKSKSERGKAPFDRADPKGTSRPRSRTPSALPASEPRRRRPRSSR